MASVDLADLDRRIAEKEAELRQRKAAAAELRKHIEQQELKGLTGHTQSSPKTPCHVYVLGVVVFVAIGNAFFDGSLFREALDPGMSFKDASTVHNPRVFFDIEIDNVSAGRVTFELFENVVPKTARNFMSLASGERGPKLHYKGNAFHRIVPGFMLQGGDIASGNGYGEPVSIFGGAFADENFKLRHDEKYVLSMANAGPGTNGAQFFVTVAKTPWLDGKHVVFGRVQSGQDVVDRIEATALASAEGAKLEARPRVVIAECGIVS